jgi:hypothetical protein
MEIYRKNRSGCFFRPLYLKKAKGCPKAALPFIHDPLLLFASSGRVI